MAVARGLTLAGRAVNCHPMVLQPGLYVVATPIGNLGDMTGRAIDTLSSADLILCEDTRLTARLCAAYGVETRRAPYHEHNAEAVRPGLIARLKEGAAFALVSDAGTPLISDPGYKLVRESRDAGIKIFTVPGPSAMTAALSISGVPTDRVLFAGFLPPKAGARNTVLREVASARATLLFYESPARLADSLAAMANVLGDRRAAVARELTKMHEEVVEGSLSCLAARFADVPPRGEIVVIVHPPEDAAVAPEEIENLLHAALREFSLRDAVDNVAATTGASRKSVYAMALTLKSGAT